VPHGGPPRGPGRVPRLAYPGFHPRSRAFVSVSRVYSIGSPGSGKSMLAARLPGLLPDLEPKEALEVR
jgi:hypothetical protein